MLFRSDLRQDVKLLEKNRKTILGLDSNFKAIVAINSQAQVKNKDSIHFEVWIPVTRPNIGRYDGFKSSGKIGTIENDSLKQNILVFYQQTIPNLAYGENYVNSVQLKILDLAIDKKGEVPMTNFLATEKLQALLNLAIYNFDSNILEYNEAIRQANKIIQEIDKDENH